MKEGEIRDERQAQTTQAPLKRERSSKEGKSRQKTKEKSSKEQPKAEQAESKKWRLSALLPLAFIKPF